MTITQWIDVFQFLMYGAGLVLLWSFRGGKATANVANDISENKLKIAALEATLERARDKQSEMEGSTTAKIGALQLSMAQIQTELAMRAKQAEKEHEAFQREISALWNRVNGKA